MTIYSYYRTSELEAALEQGELETMVQTELLSIHTYCLRQNWLVSEGVADLGCGWGLSFAARKKGGELFRELKRGDKIVCSKLERIASSSADALELVKSLREKCVQLHVVELGGDVASEHFAINFNVAADVFSTLDKRKSAERIKKVKRRQRIQGRYLGGSRPFGYTIHDDGRLIENPMEQRVLKKIVDLKQQGKSLRAISGQVSTPALPISFKTVQRLLQRQLDRR
ncbi:MAG: recombinase family protein [Gammaproteobacteria bacterium]|nr:recombinase family protein [Gammaproteobacteria bacterium]